MSNATPNLFTPDQQTPSTTPHNTASVPPTAAVVSQTQADIPSTPGFDALVSVSQQAYDDIFDETLASQTPVIPSPTQPIIPAATQTSPERTRFTGTALFGRLQDRKRTFCRDTSKKRFAKKQKSRKGVHTSMLTFLREDFIRKKINSSNGKPYDTSGVMIQIHSGFSRQCTVWKPFQKLRTLLPKRKVFIVLGIIKFGRCCIITHQRGVEKCRQHNCLSLQLAQKQTRSDKVKKRK